MPIDGLVEVDSQKELYKFLFSQMDTDDVWQNFDVTIKEFSSCPCPLGEMNLLPRLVAQFECLYGRGFSSNRIVSRLTEGPGTVPVLVRLSSFGSCRLDALTVIDHIVDSSQLLDDTRLEILNLDLFKNLLSASDLDLSCLKLAVRAMKNMVLHATTTGGRKIVESLADDIQEVLKEVENHHKEESLVMDTFELMENCLRFLLDEDMELEFKKNTVLQFHKAVEIVTLFHKNDPTAISIGIDGKELVFMTINKYLIHGSNSYVKVNLPKAFSGTVCRLMPIISDYLEFILQTIDESTSLEEDRLTIVHFKCLHHILRYLFLFGNGLESDYFYLIKHKIMNDLLKIYDKPDEDLKMIAYDIVVDFIDIVCFPGSDKFPGRDKILPILLLIIKNKKLLKEHARTTMNSYRPSESLAQNCIYHISDRGGLECYPQSYVKALIKCNAVKTIYNFATNDPKKIGYVTDVATCLAALMNNTDIRHSQELAEQVLPCIPFFLDFLTKLKPSDNQSHRILTVEITKILVNVIPKASKSEQLSSIWSEMNTFPILTEWLVQTVDTKHLVQSSLYCTQVAKIASNLSNTCSSETLAENMVDLFPILWKLLSLYYDEIHYIILTNLTKTVAPFILHHIENTEHAENLLMEVHESPDFDNHKWTVCSVPFAWCIVRRGTKSKMYDHLYKISAKKFGRAKTGNNLESKQAKVFKFLVSILIDAMESPTPMSISSMESLTAALIHMARTSSLDEEVYALEDVVSPAMWMLKRYDHPAVIKNVKEFINVLH